MSSPAPLHAGPGGAPGSSAVVEVVVPQVLDLAAALHAWAGEAATLVAPLRGAAVGGPLQGALTAFLDDQATAVGALAGEAARLADAVATAAGSWAGLDRSLVPGVGRVVPR